jgi:hypothetical protein
MSIMEFMNFKDIANFNYDFTISNGEVIVDAQAEMLAAIGY